MSTCSRYIFATQGLAVALFVPCMSGACGDDGNSDDSEVRNGPDAARSFEDRPAVIDFVAKRGFLPEFGYDTEFVPSRGPVQVRVMARSAGSVSAVAQGSVEDETQQLVAVPASGKLTLDAGLSFETNVRLGVAGIGFDGKLGPFGYTIPTSSVEFDPFLLDSEVTLPVDVSPVSLLTLPLPGVPGGAVTLSIEGGRLDLTLQGKCAAARDEMAQYVANLVVSGELKMGAVVTAELPVRGEQQFGPFVFTVPLPATNHALDFGTFTADAEPTDAAGPCTPQPGDGPEELR